MNAFTYQNNQLMVENLAIEQLIKKYSTPFYCYSASKIQNQFCLFQQSFAHLDSMICYAVKVNSNQAILTMLAKLGAGADVVSIGEIKRALLAGIKPEKIVFSGVGKTKEEMRFALNNHILCFNVESLSELNTLQKLASELKIPANISLRINPNVDAKTHKKISTGKQGDKFGIDIEQALGIYQQASEMGFINITGIDMHIGSQITQVAVFDQAIVKIKALYQNLKAQNIHIRHIDFGGGLGVKYQETDPDEAQLLEQYAEVINRHADDFNCRFIFEPGRFITANAGMLVSQIIHKKHQNDKTFLIVDAGMNDFIRPTLYDAKHQFSGVFKSDESEIVDIVGPVCETGDYFAFDQTMPKLNQDDYVVIHSTGAYCSVSASSYNSRPIIKEVLVKDNKDYLIRKEQTIEDIIALDICPEIAVS